MPKKSVAVSEKNTKAEILDAYQEMIKELEKRTSDGEVNSQPLFKPEKLQVPAVEAIVSEVGKLKVTIGQILTEVGDKMMVKVDELRRLVEEIENLQVELNDLHHIKAKAGTLKELVKLYEEKQQQLAAEEACARADWEKSKKEWEAQFKEEQTNLSRQRQREEETYHQERDHTRKQQEIIYQEKLAEERRRFEQTLNERMMKVVAREGVVNMAEAELDDLRKRASKFDPELEKAVKDAQLLMKKEVETEKEMEMKLYRQEMSGDKRVMELKIQNLQDQIKRLETENVSLKQDLQMAIKQVNQVAVKVIEGPLANRRDETVRKEEKEVK